MRNKPKKIKMCAICGLTDVSGSKDHLPPRKIFSDPLPKNLITVPTCMECNNQGSKYDETFKTFLAFILGLSPVTESLYKSAISTASKKFSRYISQNMKQAVLKTSGGIIYEKGYVLPLDEKISNGFQAVIQRTTAGLYFKHFREHIGKEKKFEIRFHYVLHKEMIETLNFGYNRIGNQFSYLYSKTCPTENFLSLWLFEFYERFWVSCAVTE
ncbi:MAG: hypothetical protein Q8L78_01550 [Coxiellaceae bacterium]|nr:hypothetical protein [Coxiellaceae bacterium]